ncbi:MAG: DNA primase [Bacteroidaceae bacterium]|nr:DNA primase [Bacteroidaceae bacterium]
MIDRATVDRILDAANIVDVVSDFVTLRRAGANLKGLCPFHDDRTPSFMVSPSKNICKCFACGEGGTPVHFIMKHEQLTYPEALRYLAKKYNIEIKERELSDEEKAAQGERESMLVVNEWANQWFQKQLYDTVDGRAVGLAYFRQRGFRDDIVRKFQLGFCPDKRDAMWRDAQKEGYNARYLLNAPNDTGNFIGTGLCIAHENGTPTDRFRGRVIWPIHSISGKVVGFGGRVLDAATKGVNVKYLNSPESIIYSKKRELYGLFLAKQAIVKQDLCYLVEGYTDVMAMHQSGVENVVASSGTALTHEQIRSIHRFTNNIVVIYDGDAAGIKASQRGIDMLLAEGMDVKLLLLPNEEDPDSFARKHTPTEFQTYLKEHQVDFIRFKTDLLMQEAQGDPIRMSKLVNNIVESLSVVPDEITRTFYIKETAQTVGMEERILTRAVDTKRKQAAEERRKQEERERAQQERGQGGNTTAQTSATPTAPAANDAIHADGGAAETQSLPPREADVPDFEDVGPEAFIPVSEAPDVPLATRKTADELRFYRREILLVQMIIRYGERVMCNVEDEQGQEQPLTVIEYIQATLQQDGLTFRNALNQRILEEAAAHLSDEGFRALRYFQNHPDEAVSNLSNELAFDKETLSKIYEKDQTIVPDEQRLVELVPRIMMDYKLAVVDEEMKRLLLQLRNPEVIKDQPQMRSLMRRLQELKQVQAQLAKACGDRVIV